MEARLNYVLLGIFLVGSLLALVLFVIWMGKYDRNLNAYNVFYAYNKELPKGIRTETPVRYLGLPIGFVKNYTLNATKDSVEIVVWIKKELTLKEGAYLSVESQGLTGGSFLSLHQGEGNPYAMDKKAALDFKANWVEKIGDKAEEVFDRLDVSLERLNILLSETNLNHISGALGNIEQASYGFNTALMRLDSVLIQANKQLQGIQESRELIDSTILRGDYNLRAMFMPLLTSLERNSALLEKILNNTDGIVNDFSQSPSGYLFGTKERVLGPRE